MKRITLLLVTLAVGMLPTGTCLRAQEHPAAGPPQVSQPAMEHQESKSQTTCPVMGGKINKNLYGDYEGKRVYFCCSMCIGKFKKDPAKYIKKLEDEGVALERVPSP